MRIVVSAMVALTLVAGSTLPAAADAPFTPDADDLVMVGSDTSQFFENDLATLYNSQTPASVRRLASFNATGTPNITIRPGVTIPRPYGSGSGIPAYLSALFGNGSGTTSVRPDLTTHRANSGTPQYG
ncbi:hypothetical protein [Streptomyces sp. SID13031]|uniref:hypothetical protein n=1 Tax=Streptomyces sp. SID13031 TaxID=2706046 RepID=UPI0013C9E424|nr:hypothetical protein [Streptomyces sp. SID13031]NEA31346.1 hypothetical protein [Streptomyces sp. SID13031]